MKMKKEFEKAVLLGDFSQVKYLLSIIDLDTIHIIDKLGRTILYDAIVKGFLEIVVELCSSGANVNLQDKNGKTPLHFSSIYNQLEISKVLIQYGSDVNLRDKNGNSPIFDAIFNSKGNPEIILLLKENGADYTRPNNYGVSPKELAKTIGNFDLSYIFE